MALTTARLDLVPFPVLGPYMDAGRNSSALQRGTFSRVVGADGRFVGSIKPFPGCRRLTFGTNKNQFSDIVAGLSTITFCKYAIVQKGLTSGELRGFVVRGTAASVVEVHFIYYDTASAAWSSTKLATLTGADATADMDVTSSGRFMYLTVNGATGYPLTIYHTGSAWVSKAMGPQYTTPVAPTSTATSATGVLPIGTYGIAYRLYDSTRIMYSGMSGVTSVAVAVGDKSITGTVPFPGGTPNDFDTIEIWRTISVDGPDGTFEGGILYKETTTALAAGWTSGTKTVSWGTVLTDYQLVQQDVYDPWEDVAGAPPAGRVIHSYQSTVFTDTGGTAVGGAAGVRWSGIGTYMPENFNAAHVYRGRLGRGNVIRLVEAGDVLHALTNSVMYRFRKAGTQLSIMPLHDGRGLTAADAAHGVGNDLLMTTGMGLAVVNTLTGDMQIHTEVDRIMLVDWISTLTSVVSAFDAAMGASFFINTSRAEVIVLWHATKCATLLKGCHFTKATSGILPETGGSARAYFVTNEGVVVYPDAEVTGNHTMLGVTGTVNGTATSGSNATTLVDSAATFAANALIKDAYIYMVTGTNAGLYRKVTSRDSTTQLTVATFPAAIAVGDRYAVSPVPFELKFPPMPSTTQENPDFERRVLTAMSIYAVGHSGISGNVNALWTVGAYREGGASLSGSNTKAMADGIVTVQPTSTAPGCLDGIKLEPFLGCYAAGVDWELTSVEFMRTIVKGRSVTSS